MSNDCARCDRLEHLRDYALAAAAHANTDHVPVEGCHVATVASRFIQAGEELFVSYGPAFWLMRQGFSAEEIDLAEVALGMELRRGGELSRTILCALQERGEASFPPWILECFEKSK